MVSKKFLRTNALFGGLMDDELDKLISYLKEESFSKGEDIIKEGETGGCLYFIVSGAVKILKNVEDEDGEVRRETIAYLKTGDTFGEMELIDIQGRAATVQAMEDTITVTLSNMDLYHIQQWRLQTYTMIIMNLAREISRRLRKMDALVASSIFHEHKRDEDDDDDDGAIKTAK